MLMVHLLVWKVYSSSEFGQGNSLPFPFDPKRIAAIDSLLSLISPSTKPWTITLVRGVNPVEGVC
ncbi:hypothetical protein EH30_09210 [Erythrobacter sp. JL475]|nr:hypothetical protein EH30_09210 [Erythrobacter sp. JL475]